MERQHLLNTLYSIEELGEKVADALKAEPSESPIGDKVNLTRIAELRGLVNDICEDIEEGGDGPGSDPNYTVVPLDQAEFWLSEQSHHFRRHYEHKGRKFRVLITRNAYDAQSHARIDGFDPQTLRWNVVAAVPFEHWPVNAKAVTYVAQLSPLGKAALYQLADTLTEKVRMLLFTPDEVA